MLARLRGEPVTAWDKTLGPWTTADDDLLDWSVGTTLDEEPPRAPVIDGEWRVRRGRAVWVASPAS